MPHATIPRHMPSVHRPLSTSSSSLSDPSSVYWVSTGDALGTWKLYEACDRTFIPNKHRKMGAFQIARRKFKFDANKATTQSDS